MTRTTFKPGGIIDVETVRKPVVDPHARYYQTSDGKQRTWVLVKSGEELERICKEQVSFWDKDGPMLVLSVEAVHERPWLAELKSKFYHVLYVNRKYVERFTEGEIASHDRFRIHETIDGRRLDLAPPKK